MARQATAEERQFKLRRGIAYSRAYTYTQNDENGNQVVLDAADYTARLVVRKRFDSAGAVVDMSTAPGLTLSTVSGSVRVTVFVASTVTAALEVGKDYKYTLALIPIATPAAVIELVTADASVEATAL